MTANTIIEGYLARFPRSAAIAYAALVLAFALVALWASLDVLQRRQEVAASADMLSVLEARNPARRTLPPVGDAAVVTGSPFLEGPTLTVAGASLMERVAAAITRAGGNILSSQVDVQGSQAKDGFVAISVSCEIEQPSLQKVLYDLEAGMPLLFVDQLVAQSPEGTPGAVGSRLHVLISVSGQWQGTK